MTLSIHLFHPYQILPRIFGQVQEISGDDPDIHLWPDKKRNDLKINALQVASDIILQKSLKEGFGLTVTEAMWKGKVVVGGNCGGIKFQIQDGVNGFLVNSPAQAAERIIQGLRNPKKANQIGQNARQSVKENFLMPRLLNNYLELLEEISPRTQVQTMPGHPALPAGRPVRLSPLSQIRHFPAGI